MLYTVQSVRERAIRPRELASGSTMRLMSLGRIPMSSVGWMILAMSSSLLLAEPPQGAQPGGAEPKRPSNSASAARAIPETAPSSATGGERRQGGAPIDPNAYVIGAEDVLNISVWHEQELTRQVIVRPDGKITMPLVNELTAAGLTPAQLAAQISEGLLKYLNSPEVNVSVQQVNSRKYFIQGEVLHPGAYPLVVPTTIMEGLANGGGFRDFANLKKITIIRGNQRLKFNYKEVREGKHLDQNVLLQPGDQIIVP
ncbi:MAG: sugar transporter [Terriglobia bacterium]|nr:MAG: sugar transporter [Terriglobia bacterium]